MSLFPTPFFYALFLRLAPTFVSYVFFMFIVIKVMIKVMITVMIMIKVMIKVVIMINGVGTWSQGWTRP